MWSDGKHRKYRCILCGLACIGYGNNPEPLAPYEENGNLIRCCDDCNTNKVLPARIANISEGGPSHQRHPSGWRQT